MGLGFSLEGKVVIVTGGKRGPLENDALIFLPRGKRFLEISLKLP